MRTFWRILWLLSGIAEIILGLYCIVHPGIALLSVAYWLGIAILVHGISAIADYGTGIHGRLGATWYLVDGILSVLLGIFLLFTGASVALAVVLPTIFAVFLICKGLFAAISSIDAKNLGGSRWGLVLIFGLLVFVLGILFFIKPVMGAVALGLLLGLFLIFMGMLTICQWHVADRIYRSFDQLRP
ncbi:MAG: HdeD family acid-resistance protein [Oscillospiraceae bacterium]